MVLDAITAFTKIHPVLEEYKYALQSLGIEPVRFPLKDRLLNRQNTAFARPDNVHRRRGKIAISSRDPLPREALLHETAHILLSHLLGDKREHEMEAALVAHYAARRLGWNVEASSAAQYAKRYARHLQSSGETSGETGHEIVISAYAPDGATQEKIRAAVEKIVSAFQNRQKS